MMSMARVVLLNCRSLHWERGLKHQALANHPDLIGRSLHWERGLKHGYVVRCTHLIRVAPFIGSVD